MKTFIVWTDKNSAKIVKKIKENLLSQLSKVNG